MPPDRASTPLGWFGIVRLGLVQTALGAIVVLTTSTLNRIMVVELALPALLPGLLVGWHYVLQVLRPRWGYQSDRAGRRTPWIVGGMALLAAGGALAAAATALMGANLWLGVGLAAAAFTLIGVGVGCAGTSLLVLLAERTDERRRAPAATCVWLMMIAGFVVTTVAVGQVLDPYSPLRLVVIVGVASLLAFCLAAVAVQGVEGPGRPAAPQEREAPFGETLRQVWAEPAARRFTTFIFASMVAYSAQDLILEPFAGAVHGMTPGQSTKLGGLQHGGVFAGMILAPAIMALTRRRDAAALRGWMVWGCLGSAVALLAIALGGFAGDSFPLKPAVFALGLANGVFAVSAIAAMMSMASDGAGGRDGTRIGLWGAAQALAFGLGGLTGAAGADLARLLVGDPRLAYAAVFALEAGVFVASAALAAWIRIERPEARPRQAVPQPAAQPVFAGE